MSFADIAARPRVALCVIGTILGGLDDAETTALAGMLAADLEVWPHTGADSIQEAFKDEGYTVGEKTIRAHRARACRCYRDAS